MFSELQGKFYIRIEDKFESSHYLYNYFPDGSDEPIHGHSWKIEVYISGKSGIKADGICFDFLTAKKKLKELSEAMDHRLINEHPDFKGINPTSENIARWFYYYLQHEVEKENGKIKKIVIHEGPENLAFFEPD
ncbi:MAG: 6-carboxytetrahydropterin synthase [Leptospiraceae bacterium]|nr:6-carboxytetrahydropterin synthase [Leptospiraceae bacterium]MCP5498770.1 6-carboxytetrahydropterin synthase [Leptospiraceae bacterium]